MAKNQTNIERVGGFFNILPNSNSDSNIVRPNNKLIIRGSSPDEVKLKNLELQQQKHLTDKFFKTTNHAFQKSMQYEAARLPAYLDYEGMEYYPIIASALDLFMEEATTIGENGKMLSINSNKERIKNHLEELFYNIIDVNSVLPSWIRSMCKYGDNFVHILGENKKGITNAKQLVNYDIDRLERVKNGKLEVKFLNKTTGLEYNIFEVAHFRLLGDDKYFPYGSSLLNKIRRVFRQLIMAEDAMLTYRIIRAGEKRVFKIDVGNIDQDDIEEYIQKVATRFKKQQQVYPNDGQIDYRFNILGNDEDYFIPVRNANVQTGIDTLQGACLSLDTKINLLDGRVLSLSEIIDSHNNGDELWTYSIDLNSGQIVPSPITWAGITRKNTEVLKITLDNGESVICTPDHKFPVKYGDYVEAKDLKEGESLWSFNEKTKNIRNSNKGYHMVYDHSINDWVFTHRMVDVYFNGESESGSVVHHENFNRFDNSPSNLRRMDSREHFKLHAKHSKIGSDAYKEKYENDPEFKSTVDSILKNARKRYHTKLSNDKDFSADVKKKQSKSRKKYLSSLSDDEFKKATAHLYLTETRKKAFQSFKNNVNYDQIVKKRSAKQRKTKSTPEFKEKFSLIRKKIWENPEFRKSVIEKQTIKYDSKLINYLTEYLKEYSQIKEILKYKINIDNSEFVKLFLSLNKDNMQFTRKFSKITNNNINKLLRFYGYKNWRDFKSKQPYYNHKIISIEYLNDKRDTGTLTIDGDNTIHGIHNFPLACGVFTKNSNLSEIADLEYLRDNLFTGLGTPKQFLSFQQSSGDGKNMAQMDIRFSKKINRIQQSVIHELNKMAIIHLLLLGFDESDLRDFSLSLNNASVQEEMLRMELLNTKSSVYTELTRSDNNGIAAMSHTEAKRRVFNWSDKDIIDDLKKQKMERSVAQEIANAPVLIKNTHVFDDIDAKYGDDSIDKESLSAEGEEGDENMPPIDGGGPDAPQSPDELPDVIGQGKGFKEKVKGQRLTEDEFNETVIKLVKVGKEETQKKQDKTMINEITEKSNLLTKKSLEMIGEIDDRLNKNVLFNTNKNMSERNFKKDVIFNEDLDITSLGLDDIDKKDLKKK